MKPTFVLVPVLMTAAFLIGRVTRADEQSAETAAAKYYKIRITTEFSHDFGYWAHEVFLPEQEVGVGLEFDREEVLDKDRSFVEFIYTPKAHAWNAERSRADFADAWGRSPLAIANVRIPVSLARTIKEYANLTERWRAEGYRVGKEVASALSLGPDVLPLHEGQVLSVDPRTKVVIISLGADEGVVPSLKYSVSRGNEAVGTIEITEVQAKQSLGRSIEGLQHSEIQRGDKVRCDGDTVRNR